MLRDGEMRCAKAYKEASQRGFHKRALCRDFDQNVDWQAL